MFNAFQWNYFNLVYTCNIALILYLKRDVTKFRIPPPPLSHNVTLRRPLNVWRNLWMAPYDNCNWLKSVARKSPHYIKIEYGIKIVTYIVGAVNDMWCDILCECVGINLQKWNIPGIYKGIRDITREIPEQKLSIYFINRIKTRSFATTLINYLETW